VKTRSTGEGGRWNRAVSETMGFVFAFALVTASVGVVYTTGIGGLEDARENEQVTNAVRAFDVLHDNIEDVTREDAPSRATELKLQDASLGYGDPVRIDIQANHSDVTNESYAITTRPLVYESSAGTVVFSAGATFRAGEDDAVMRAEPAFVVDDQRSVLPTLITYPRGDDSGVAGSTTVLVVAHRQSSQLDGVFAPDGAKANVTVTVESPRASAWARYFEDQGMNPVGDEPNGGEASYYFETDSLLVPQTAVEFEIH